MTHSCPDHYLNPIVCVHANIAHVNKNHRESGDPKPKHDTGLARAVKMEIDIFQKV